MSLPRLIQSGVCEEPYLSIGYNVAELEYYRGLRELASSDSIDYGNDANFNCSINHFARSVGLLRDLHALGEVENIDRLPSEDEVKFLNRKKMVQLADLLGQLYFRDGNN